MIYPIQGVYADPSAVLDFGFDLAPFPTPRTQPWLAAGETIVDLDVTADQGVVVSDTTIGPNVLGIAGSQIIAWLSGFTLGMTCTVRFKFTTSDGRTDTKSLRIQSVLK